MLNSFRFWCFTAGIMSLLLTLLHVVSGGPRFHDTALASPLSEVWKAAFSTVWHEITALLLLNGLALMGAGLALRKNQLLLWLVVALNVAFGVLFAGYGVVRLGTPLILLQWVLFAAIAACVFVAIVLPDALRVVEEKAPPAVHFSALPHADFSDTYVVHDPHAADALEVARIAFSQAPGWISALLQLRNFLVKPFGLVNERPSEAIEAVGMFPVLSRSDEKVILGLDDRHLDFRVIVELLNNGETVSMTTLVKTHHIWGKAYLVIITPFHRMIAATILARAARS